MSDLRADAPIGVFDSGLGGLTVVRRIVERLPNESILFVADQAHVPYGGRSLEQVRGFALAISASLFAQGCKAVVMACNISSATALTHVRCAHPRFPVVGVVEPGAGSAARRSISGRIGVLATEGTVRSGAYTKMLSSLRSDAIVTEVACPLLVPLVESGRSETAEAEEAARAYLAPLLAADVDTVVLGCTHYPFLLPVLRRAAPDLTFIDPAEATVDALAAELERSGVTAPTSARASHALTTTGERALFTRQLAAFLPNVAADVRPAKWIGGRLELPARVAA